VPPNTVQPPDNRVKSMLGHVGHISIFELFTVVEPAPTRNFELEDHTTWRVRPMTVEQLVTAPWAANIRYEWTAWNALIESIPFWVVRTMAFGPPCLSNLVFAWGATEAPSDDPDGPFADIYYFDRSLQKKGSNST
jgi:hypothetical protein